MSKFWNTLHYFWEEEAPPPGEVQRPASGEPVGVPRPVRAATRFLLIGTVAVGLMSQVIGIRLVTPVDAQVSYRQQCYKDCAAQNHTCRQNTDQAWRNCRQAAQQAFTSCVGGCSALRGMDRVRCQHSCEAARTAETTRCNRERQLGLEACDRNVVTCRLDCPQD